MREPGKEEKGGRGDTRGTFFTQARRPQEGKREWGGVGGWRCAYVCGVSRHGRRVAWCPWRAGSA